MKEFLGRWLNLPLMSEPLNWAIIFVLATFWLIAFHVVMQAFNALQGQPAFASTAGLVAAPQVSATGDFLAGMSGSQFPTVISQAQRLDNLSPYGPQGGEGWAILSPEPVFAEDGWTEIAG